jgi:hypothetical protein
MQEQEPRRTSGVRRRNTAAVLAAVAVLGVVAVAYGASRGDGGRPGSATTSVVETADPTPTGLPTELPTSDPLARLPAGVATAVLCATSATATGDAGAGPSTGGCTGGPLTAEQVEQLRRLATGSLPPEIASEIARQLAELERQATTATP